MIRMFVWRDLEEIQDNINKFISTKTNIVDFEIERTCFETESIYPMIFVLIKFI